MGYPELLSVISVVAFPAVLILLSQMVQHISCPTSRSCRSLFLIVIHLQKQQYEKERINRILRPCGTAITFFSCGTQQTATKPAAAPLHRDSIVAVEPLKEVITIAEALDMYQNPDKAAAITKKYGYKLKPNYEVYRLDKFSKMYYKNCTLAKLLTVDKYADYPKPMRKGVSSYIAFKDGAIIIAVFNQAAYDNLVGQVKTAGFTLDMPGSEDIYTDGVRTIACYKDGKSVRIQ